MLELISLLVIGLVAVGAVLLVGAALKLLFKIVLLPVWLALGLIKLVVGIVAAVAVAIVCLVVAPLAVVLLLFVGLPLLALFALFGLGWTLVAA